MPQLPTARAAADLPQVLHGLVVSWSEDDGFSSFAASDGALVDLAGLQAIAASPSRVLDATLTGVSPTSSGLILSGLELAGSPLIWPVEIRRDEAVERLEILSRGLIRPGRELRISEGTALVTDREGRRHAVTVDHPMTLTGRPRSDSVVVLEVELTGGTRAARQEVVPIIRYATPEEARQPHCLPIACAAGNQTWATDLRRIYQPGHEVIRNILVLIEYLEHVVWDSDRHGWAWQRRQQGREWSRYQTTATLALQATRTGLMTHASTTSDRVRLLQNLHYQLRRSVENAEESMTKWLGQTGPGDPYRTIAPLMVELRGPAGRPPPQLLKRVQEIFGDYAMRAQTSSSSQVHIHAPLTALGRDTLRSYLQQLAAQEESLHRSDDRIPAAENIEVHVQGAQPVPLSDTEAIIERLVAASGWEPE